MNVRDRGNGPEFEEQRNIDLDGMLVSEVADYLQEKAEGLIDPCVHVDIEYSYGDEWISQFLSGWRPATDDEVRRAARERADAEQRQRIAEEQQAARLRKARPDLFIIHPRKESK